MLNLTIFYSFQSRSIWLSSLIRLEKYTTMLPKKGVLCFVSSCVPFTNSLLECYFIMMVATMTRIYMTILLTLIYTLMISVTNYFWFCRYAPLWMFLSLDIFFEYWIEHVTFGLLYVTFRLSTRVFYRGVPGFATYCASGGWCRGLTTCLLHVDPLSGNLVCYDSGFVSLT